MNRFSCPACKRCTRSQAYSFILLAALLTAVATTTLAQAPEAAKREPLRVIDMPTAGINHRGEFNTDLRIYPNGGILAQMGIGLFRRFMFGISYGGSNVVGRGKIEGNKQPGMLVKYRLWEETTAFPAIALGYDNQGFGAWLKTYNRYEYKSPGLFIASSKNFSFGTDRNFGVHGVVNWNGTETDDDSGMDVSVGGDFSLNEELIALAEYNFALNDYRTDKSNRVVTLGQGNGYLNAGVRWAVGKIYLQFEFKDILANRLNVSGPDRAFSISYAEAIQW